MSPYDTLTRALSHRGRGAQSWIPSPGDPLLFPMQRVTGEGQGEGAAPTCEATSRIIGTNSLSGEESAGGRLSNAVAHVNTQALVVGRSRITREGGCQARAGRSTAFLCLALGEWARRH